MNNTAESGLENRERPIFLHAGWRSRGTWLWDKLREQPGVMAFYEPLHEDLAALDVATIGHLRPDSWGSLHGEGAPYFQEYGALLGPSGRGVRRYQRRFAFSDFFLAAGGTDEALDAYINQLLDAAREEGRRPVLKFCRSLGRVGWMRERFPGAFHAVVLRDPVAQWRSSRQQWEADGNSYFILAPFLILARNAGNPLLRDAMQLLGVPAPVVFGNTPGATVTTTWRHVQRLNWAQRYRGFLAVWAATAMAAGAAGAGMIDADRLDEAEYRGTVEASFAALGLPLDLRPRDTRAADSWAGTADEARDAAAAGLAALGFLNAHLDSVPVDQARTLAHKLTPRFTLPGGTATQLAAEAGAKLRRAVAPAWLRRVDAAVYLAVQTALYPVRRAHYYLWRWLGWHAGPGVKVSGHKPL